MKNNVLQLDKFSLSFKDNLLFKNVDHTFTPGIYAFSGPSGVGKSTLMRAMAGLNREYTGSIMLNGNVLNGPSPMVHMVHQHYTSYPWLNCIDNTLMVYKGHKRKVTKEIRDEAINMLKELGLEEHLGKKPGQLSGGQDQRLSIASALINDMSPVILYDEMTSALDDINDLLVADLIKRHQAKNNNIIIVITHEDHVIRALGGNIIYFTEQFRIRG